MIHLYYYPDNASLAPHILLEEMGIPYQLILIDRKKNEQKNEAYIKLNPNGRIPTLIDDGMVIFESAAICLYLVEKFKAEAIFPNIIDNPRRHAKCLQWLFYLTNTIQPALMQYIYPEKWTENSDGAHQLKNAIIKRLDDGYSIIDHELRNHPYMVEDQFSICDPFLFMLAKWSWRLPKPPKQYPKLFELLTRLTERPAFIHTFEQELISAPYFEPQTTIYK